MPIAGCFCYGSNTPELKRHCTCQQIDLRTPEQKVREAQIETAMNAAIVAAGDDEEAAMEAVFDRNGALEELYSGTPGSDDPPPSGQEMTVTPEYDMTLDYCHCGAIGDQGHQLSCILEQMKRRKKSDDDPKHPGLLME